MKQYVVVFFAVLLSACGGGGGGGGTSSGNAPPPVVTTPAPPVSNDPCLTLSPNPMNLSFTQGSAPMVDVQASANCNFPDVINVAVIDKAGAFTPNINVTPVDQYHYVARMQVSPTLAAGSYDGTLEIRLCKDDPTVCNQPHKGSPWTLPYHLQVNLPVTWSIATPAPIMATSASSTASLTAQTAIKLDNSAAVQWHATSNVAWLKVVNASGLTNGASLQLAVDAAEFAKLPNFADYTAVVSISADTPGAPATTVAVTLKKNIAEMNYAGPYTLLPGETALVHLHGHGFSALGDLSQFLQVNASGISVSNAKVVSDGEITVQASAGSAGTASFSISNAMGMSTGSASVKIVPPPPGYAYQAFASEGYKGTLLFDAERQALLVVNRGQHQLLRYAYAGGAWTQSSASIDGADDAGLSPDGKSLLVTSTSGLLSLLDPATLALQASFQNGSYVAGTSVGSRLAVLNDGRAWFPQGEQWNNLVYFDLHTHQFGRQGTQYYGGPVFSVSGDGERMAMTPSLGLSPPPPVEYMDTVDDVIRDNPDPYLTQFIMASQSRDGSRILFEDISVRDNQFNVLGKFVLDSGPYAGGSYGTVISPDGTRSYLMFLGPRTDPAMKPRIYVFDTSRAVTGAFPILGYIDVPDSPTSCMQGDYCDPRMSTAITPDGKTLFFSGNKNTLVVPVPAVLQH